MLESSGIVHDRCIARCDMHDASTTMRMPQTKTDAPGQGTRYLARYACNDQCVDVIAFSSDAAR